MSGINDRELQQRGLRLGVVRSEAEVEVVGAEGGPTGGAGAGGGVGMEPLMNVREIMRLLGVSRTTVYSWVNQKKIQHLRVNGVLRFSPEMVRVWLRGKARVIRFGGRSRNHGCP